LPPFFSLKNVPRFLQKQIYKFCQLIGISAHRNVYTCDLAQVLPDIYSRRPDFSLFSGSSITKVL